MTLDTEQATGQSIRSGVESTPRTRSIDELVHDLETAGWLHNRAQLLVTDTTEIHEAAGQLHADHLEELLRTVTTQIAQSPFQETLDELSRLGFSWRAIADMVGVSIPALRKWRTGQSDPSGDNRFRVARVLAFCRLVSEHFLIQDVAGWLETPIHPDAPVTGLDLLADGHFEQAFVLARQNGADPEEVLDAVRPSWREDFKSDVEVFIAADGQPGLRTSKESP